MTDGRLLSEVEAIDQFIWLRDPDPGVRNMAQGRIRNHIEAQAERIEELEADAEIGKLVRRMRQGTRLYRGTDFYAAYGQNQHGIHVGEYVRSASPVEALASTQSQTVGGCEEESE